jgi:hypothetical protein
MRLQLCRSGTYGHQQKISKYNAWQHAKSLIVNEGACIFYFFTLLLHTESGEDAE